MLHESAFTTETDALKLEYCLVTFLDPQVGHAGNGVSARGTSFSNGALHFVHSYS